MCRNATPIDTTALNSLQSRSHKQAAWCLHKSTRCRKCLPNHLTPQISHPQQQTVPPQIHQSPSSRPQHCHSQHLPGNQLQSDAVTDACCRRYSQPLSTHDALAACQHTSWVIHMQAAILTPHQSIHLGATSLSSHTRNNPSNVLLNCHVSRAKCERAPSRSGLLFVTTPSTPSSLCLALHTPTD